MDTKHTQTPEWELLRNCIALCDQLIHTDGKGTLDIASDLRPKIEAEMLALPVKVAAHDELTRRAESAEGTMMTMYDRSRRAEAHAEALRALLLDIEHCSDALAFRADLVERLREFKTKHNEGVYESA